MRILLSLLAFSLIAPSALAQAQLLAEPTNTNTSPVQAAPVRSTDDTDDNNADTAPDEAIILDSSTPSSGDEVGGDGEDIGAPSADAADKDNEDEIGILSPETEDGDPDRPIIVGSLPNAETTGIEGDDIGITRPDEQQAAADVFLKLDGVDGEASDGTSSDSQTAPSQTRVILLAPSAEDSSISHDPGVALIEQLAAIGIDDDDFGFVSNGKPYVRAGFVKLGDIKGESSDSTSGGNAETTWKVEKGEKAVPKKPREIVVVGSKAKETADKSSPKLFEALCSGLHATCEPQDAVTPDLLRDFAQRTVNTYDSVTEIRMDDSKVEIQSTQPFKLFGFIPLRLRQTVSVSVDPDTFGRVKVKLPWYHIFGRKTVRPHDLKTDLEKEVGTAQFSKWEVAELDATKDDPGSGPAGEKIMADETSTTDRPSESITFNFSEVKAQLLQTISNVIVQYNESDLNFISR